MPSVPVVIERLFIVTIILVVVDEIQNSAAPSALCFCLSATDPKDAMKKGVEFFDKLYLDADGEYRYQGLLFRHEYTHAGILSDESVRLLEQSYANGETQQTPGVPHDGNRAPAEQSSHDGNRAPAEQSSHDGKIVQFPPQGRAGWKPKRPKKPSGGKKT